MSNHSDKAGDSPFFTDQLRKIMGKPLIGATGQHPEGKLTPHDEGGIQFAVGVKDHKVCVDFGTPVAWIGFGPEQAVELGQLLIRHAREAARGTGIVLTVTL
jgi:hypothetical protein